VKIAEAEAQDDDVEEIKVSYAPYKTYSHTVF
jgi:hypothetical protein